MTFERTPSRRAVFRTLGLGLGGSYVGVAAHAASPSGSGIAGGQDVLVTQFGARGDGTADDTDAFERAIQAAADSGRRLRIPAGRFRITRTLEINRGIRIEGDGVENSIILGLVGPSRPVVHVRARETDSIIGFGMSGIKFVCGDGAGACDGIKLSTSGKGAAIQQAVLRDLFISDVGTGIAISGVVYRSCLDNITVSGNVRRYGFYCDRGFEDVTYNSFWNLEVTNVASGAYAYWVHSNYSNFLNLTADGCCYFSSPGGSLRNIAVEGIVGRRPPSDSVIELQQVQTVEGVNLIGIDPAKCGHGIKVVGQATVIRGVRCMAQQPGRLFDLDVNSEGIIAGVQTEHPAALIESYVPAETLDRWVLQAAQAVTRRRLVHADGN